ncbi:MAG: hypothetical protein AAGE52_34475, partial [Myxococcota bacterium]
MAFPRWSGLIFLVACSGPVVAPGQECASERDCQAASECAVAECVDGGCELTSLRAGHACAEGMCNGSGACVECVSGGDCSSGRCVDGACEADTCGDGLRNGAESDVDCGGECGPCADAMHCDDDDDCRSASCDEVCAGPTCSDGRRNGDETDVDCGGGCPPCAPALVCGVSS